MEVESQNSSEWITQNAADANILKLDIEGGELDFLIVANEHLQNFVGIVAECNLDSP